jgi:uncharacterized protein YqgC (DUF456 family)
MWFYVVLVVFIVAMVAFWLLNLFGLPGNWMMLALAIIWAWCIETSNWDYSWWTILAMLLLAGVGELVEFVASVVGTKGVGGSRRAAAYSVIGSVAGAILGAILGSPIPIPIIGMLIGSILFACVGALVGAYIGERRQGSEIDHSLKVGGAAFVGRFFGTIGKILCGVAILILAIFGLFF